MVKVGVFHPGTQHSWQTAYAFQESNELEWFLSSIYFTKNSFESNTLKYLPKPLRSKIYREMTRRSFHSLDDSKVHTSGLIEWLEVLSNRYGYRNIADKLDWLGNKTFYKHVESLYKKQPVDILWGYNNSSLESFRWAKAQGIRTVLDQTIGHPISYNSIIAKEVSKYPGYFFKNKNYVVAQRIAERNQAEAQIADLVVVGSDFCADTMIKNGCDYRKIRVIPYGYDEKIFLKDSPSSCSSPMRFLFVGSVIPRKGLHYLFEAFKRIPEKLATLEIVGSIGVPLQVIDALPANIKFYGSVPRTEVSRFFDQADVFIFPSLFEGGGIVLYEACSAGLAIIQSAACGDGVRKENGIILDDVNEETLFSSIMKFIENPTLVNEMKNKSFVIRNERSWEKYRHEVRLVASAVL